MGMVMDYQVKQIGNAIGAEVFGDGDIIVSGVAEPSQAKANDIALAMDAKYAADLPKGQAQVAMLWPGADWQAMGLRAAIVAPRPRFSLSGLSAMMDPGQSAPNGIHPTAARLMQTGVDLFAVANVKEAMDIREMGSGWPVLILGPLLEEEDQALLEYDLIPTLSNEKELDRFINLGKAKGKLVDKANIKVTFKDVAGLEGAKEEISEIVDFLKKPEKYTKLGGKIPRGAMLIGPPGTGKTLLAKAVAGEAKVPFFSLSGSDFVEMFVGVGASRVRDLFKQAKEKAPSIIFIDEIDAIGRARGKNAMTGSNDERENTLNQLLTEMDGFGTNTGVIVMAATNRADILDKALTRAGRFDRQIYVDLPDLVERKEIFKVHLKPIRLAKNIDINFLARQTPGFSGADIANVCNEAALIAARTSKKTVGKQDFLDAVDRIVGGLEKKSKIISPTEKKTIAFHEAGHATVSWMLEHASPLVKVTIVPRGRSLGAAWYLPEERQLTTTEQMKDEICAALGGRAAESIFFDKVSTGALSDLEKVTKQAYAMVSIYGLSPKLGNISYYDSSGQNSGFTKPYSEERAKLIDSEVSSLIEEQYNRALKVLKDNKKKVEELANALLKNEVIFKDNLISIFGARKWKSYEEEKLEELDIKSKKEK